MQNVWLLPPVRGEPIPRSWWARRTTAQQQTKFPGKTWTLTLTLSLQHRLTGLAGNGRVRGTDICAYRL